MDFFERENLLELYNPLNNGDTYSARNHIRLLSITKEEAVGEMTLGPDLSNENFDLHGAAMYALADTVAGVAARVWGVYRWGPQTGYTTATSSFSYLRPLHLSCAEAGQRIICTATLQKAGRSLSVTDVSIRSEKGTELCIGTFTGCYIDMDRYRKSKPEEENG